MREMRRLSLAWPLPYGWEKQEAMLVSHKGREGRRGGREGGEEVRMTQQRPYIRTLSDSSLPPSFPPSLLQASKPARYLAHLLGHEGKGSLHSYLNQQGWIESLSAGSSVKTADMDMFKVGR